MASVAASAALRGAMLTAASDRPAQRSPAQPETPPKRPPPIELCGLGTWSAAARASSTPAAAIDTTGLPGHLGSDAIDEARVQLLAALQAGPPRWRVAALLLDNVFEPDEALRRQRAWAIARAAAGSGDAVALHWAEARCADDGACSDAVLPSWLQAESHNAVPWLRLLERAPQREPEALAMLRRATRHSHHWGVLADTVRQAMPAQVLPYVQAGLLVQAMGVESALSPPALLPLLGRCRPAPTAGSDRQADCDRWARLLTEQADTLMARRVGVRMAELAGWPAARTAALGRELDGLLATRNVLVLKQPLSCSGVEAIRTRVAAVAQQGELAALEALTAPAAWAPR